MEDKKKKVRFTLLDAVIIVAVIALVFVAASMMGFVNPVSVGTDAVNVKFSIELKNMDDRIKDEIVNSVGTTFEIGDKGGQVATLTNVTFKRAEVETFNSLDGTYQIEQRTKNWDIIAELEGKGSESEDSVKLGGKEIRIGTKAYLKNAYIGPEGFVLTLDTVKEGK